MVVVQGQMLYFVDAIRGKNSRTKNAIERSALGESEHYSVHLNR